jgi:hypothetical protein
MKRCRRGYKRHRWVTGTLAARRMMISSWVDVKPEMLGGCLYKFCKRCGAWWMPKGN